MPTAVATQSNEKRQRSKPKWREQGAKPVRATLDETLIEALAGIVGVTDPTEMEAMRAPLELIASDHLTRRRLQANGPTRPDSNAGVKKVATDLGALGTKLETLPGSAHALLVGGLPDRAYFTQVAQLRQPLDDADLLSRIEMLDELAAACFSAGREAAHQGMKGEARNLQACGTIAQRLFDQLPYLDVRGQQAICVELARPRRAASEHLDNDTVAVAVTLVRQMEAAASAAYQLLAAERGPKSDTALWISVNRLAALFEQWTGARVTHSTHRNTGYAGQAVSDFGRFCTAFFKVVDGRAVQRGLPDAITIFVRLRDRSRTRGARKILSPAGPPQASARGHLYKPTRAPSHTSRSVGGYAKRMLLHRTTCPVKEHLHGNNPQSDPAT